MLLYFQTCKNLNLRWSHLRDFFVLLNLRVNLKHILKTKSYEQYSEPSFIKYLSIIIIQDLNKCRGLCIKLFLISYPTLSRRINMVLLSHIFKRDRCHRPLALLSCYKMITFSMSKI